MNKEEVVFIGYWNGSSDEWVLTKVPQEETDLLVTISVEVVPTMQRDSSAELKRAMKKLPRELRNLVKDLKKWSK